MNPVESWATIPLGTFLFGSGTSSERWQTFELVSVYYSGDDGQRLTALGVPMV